MAPNTKTYQAPARTVEAPVAATGPSASTTRFTPDTIDDAYRLGRLLYRSGLMPKAFYDQRYYPTAEDGTAAITTIVLYGAELGLTPMQAVRGMHVIEGVPTLSADMMVALVKRSPRCAYFEVVEGGDDFATVEAARVDASGKVRPPRRLTVRLWWGKVDECPKPTKDTYWILPSLDKHGNPTKPYQRTPGRMCAARAKSYLCRDQFEDVVLGLYAADEVVEFADPRTAEAIADSILDMVETVPLHRAPEEGGAPTTTAAAATPAATQERPAEKPTPEHWLTEGKRLAAAIASREDEERVRAYVREGEAVHGREVADKVKLAIAARMGELVKQGGAA